MERFYIVPNESKLAKDYVDFEQNLKEVNEQVKKVCDEFEIEADGYTIGEAFKIIPTKNDYNKFDSQFTQKRFDYGLRQFKKNSEISKRLFELISKNVNFGKVLQKPYVPFYFKCGMKTRSRLFREGELIYCSFESDEIFGDDELVQITPNEFYSERRKYYE